MADDFYEQFNATLGINDMSLSGEVCLIYAGHGVLLAPVPMRPMEGIVATEREQAWI